jgi:hypothetical protein
MTRLALRLRRCGQCYRYKTYTSFIGARGAPVRMCEACRRHYGSWNTKTLGEKMRHIGRRKDPAPTGQIIWSLRSGNKKTGPIPVSISERGTCPPSCGFYAAGCYAEYGVLGSHWRGVSDRGISWEDFLASVRVLPEGQLWRHNEAGDLAGVGDVLDRGALAQLVDANRGRRGFTFTHRTREEDFEVIRWANLNGFTINLSADSLTEADALYQDPVDDDAFTRAGPVVAVLPHDAPSTGIRTPAGRRVVVCPAQTHGLTCAECELCAHPFRASVIGFRAHGQFKRHVPELVQLRRKAEGRASIAGAAL